MASESQGGLRLIVVGLVQSVTKRIGQNGDTFLTLLKTPAKDEYSSPGTFEVRSKSRIGKEGAVVEVECDLLGYSRSYKRKDDGESVKTAEHVLQAV